ncbi:aminopeptidase N [Methanolinea mesophila]|uniref:M1 family metallopeptidase n=1 Tax=Methanolinea mesophila TaxID=547055 RepID=UPI001AE5F558|nr:M1 family metallopeptidase [Methanolinea mesophila]MBP1929918.1 aminopeptidase N [Methanolinea mesophila]
MERIYKYYPGDFGELTVKVLHMDLVFNIHDDFTRVGSRMKIRVLDRPIASLDLNARGLEIEEVAASSGEVTYNYDRDSAILRLKFARPLPPGTECELHTVTTCRPSRNVLEGLYYDRTPPGAPPTQITQCQQWGFQRLLPCIDDMTAKCTYRTTLEADRRYTTLISNGDQAGPRKSGGDGRDSVTYENMLTPMAPYLFFVGAGTYATFSRECEYPDGHTFSLELLVPPGSDPVVARHALDVMNDAIIWVYLFTGPEMYRDLSARMRMWDLCAERDRSKDGTGKAGDLPGIRKELADLAAGITPGYAYTGAVYREIGMQNSDFGGMENVGNTTIAMNRIMPYPQMTDSSFEYMVTVKVHEFYHNLNGSEVTGKSPFEIWLNEAVTVVMELKNHAFLFGEDYVRLQTVLTLLSPTGGTFALDQGAAAMPIEPDGFNDPNELITGVTYVKAPEFVRMIETLMGKEEFARGLALYHRRYRHSNASRTQWVEAMEEISGQEFAGMAEAWLKKTGFPRVSVIPGYDEDSRTFSMEITQESSQGDDTVFSFPFRFALVDREGKDIAERTVRIEGRATRVTIPDVDRAAFLSLNRGYSYYGLVDYDPGIDALYLQVRKDPDLVNRYVAFSRITEQEMIRMLSEPGALPDRRFTDLFFELISDDELMRKAGGLFLTIFDSVEDPRWSHRYRDLWHARRAIIRAVAQTYEGPMKKIYREYSRPAPGDRYLSRQIRGIRDRQVKNVALAVLATLDTPEVRRIIMDQYDHPAGATDRSMAMGLYLDSSAPDRMEFLQRAGEEAAASPVSFEVFLATAAGNSSPDAVKIVKAAEALPEFRLEQADHQRALFGRFAMNRKVSLETPEGREYLAGSLLRLAKVNEYSTVMALQALSTIDGMDPGYLAPVAKILADLLASTDPGHTPSVYNTTRRLLRGSPKALAAYEAEHGPVQGLK